MARAAATVLAFLVVQPGNACMYAPEVELSDDSLKSIKAYIDENYSEVSSSTPIRNLVAYGLLSASGVKLEFSSHRSTNGAEFYYSLSCNRAENSEWSCSKLHENRSIRIDNPEDTIDIDATLDANVGYQIAQSIRKSIVIDEGAQYTYFVGPTEKTSVLPLDLLRIRKIDNGRYLVTAWSGLCSGHEIEVKEIACGLKYCSFEVLRNELKYYV